nr:transposase [Gemmatimonadota bacterium]
MRRGDGAAGWEPDARCGPASEQCTQAASAGSRSRSPLAVRLGYDAKLLAALAERLARAVMQDMRLRAKQQHGLASVATLHAGVVTVVQRFRSDLGLYVHLHCLVTDGVYEEQGGELRFLPAPPPTPERMTAVLAQVHEVV